MSASLEAGGLDHSRIGLTRVKLIVLGVSLLLLILILFWLGIDPRRQSESHVQENLKALGEAAPAVSVVHPKPEASQHQLSLPASLEAIQAIKIQARVDGYVGQWFADIGDRVRPGQLLARIEAPELQQQAAEAQAAIAEAEALVAQASSDVRRVQAQFAQLKADQQQAQAEVGQNQAELKAAQSEADFARVSNQRWQKLVSDRAISLQEADQRAASWRSAEANVRAIQEKLAAARSRVLAAQARQAALRAEVQSAQARVHSAQAQVAARRAAWDRIQSQLAFTRVTAPFAGVITQRSIDVGSLVSAGGDKTAMFDLARATRLRAFVDVPEGDAPAVKVGLRTSLTLSEFPRRIFQGTVTRTAGALDPGSRTLRTQIELENPGELNPGMHAQVKFPLKSGGGYTLPSTATMTTPDGLRVAVLDGQRKVHFRLVKPGRDYGQEIQILSGLQPEDEVINYPSDDLSEGTQVHL
ncbi:efflux RND transporter periplasmic adaptor subunit [bacterium]|nr:efflux RND transporter periplasmic adaptor subunit [bacterium]